MLLWLHTLKICALFSIDYADPVIILETPLEVANFILRIIGQDRVINGISSSSQVPN